MNKEGLEAILSVLILILLEYGLRLLSVIAIAQKMQCLNPYSIGIWSATH